MKNGVKIIMKYFVFRATNDLERRCAKNKRTKLSKENKDKIRRKDRKKGEKLQIQQWRHTLLEEKKQ